ncbi:hypothetical protein [Neobacillus niacini]|uniref:hypothetical protein n=1 Tax=Neobacillus niacini TaxID=86668 RepID=UPI0021CB9579|nr:hypothetical protein [Neobacillus niacini]MCM3766331.1 hypothetical protein [Neobacillus niacini]
MQRVQGEISRKKQAENRQINTVRLNIDVQKNIRDNFRDAVERNGRTMKEVLTIYMQKYIWKQGELQRNREKRRQKITRHIDKVPLD